MTRTLAILEISQAAHDEIRQRLINAGAADLIQGNHLIMEDIALMPIKQEKPHEQAS